MVVDLLLVHWAEMNHGVDGMVTHSRRQRTKANRMSCSYCWLGMPACMFSVDRSGLQCNRRLNGDDMWGDKTYRPYEAALSREILQLLIEQGADVNADLWTLQDPPCR
jgi:hypothetical protein